MVRHLLLRRGRFSRWPSVFRGIIIRLCVRGCRSTICGVFVRPNPVRARIRPPTSCVVAVTAALGLGFESPFELFRLHESSPTYILLHFSLLHLPPSIPRRDTLGSRRRFARPEISRGEVGPLARPRIGDRVRLRGRVVVYLVRGVVYPRIGRCRCRGGRHAMLGVMRSDAQVIAYGRTWRVNENKGPSVQGWTH